MLMLSLLEMIYVYRFYSSNHNHVYSLDMAINHFFEHIFDVNNFQPNLTFKDTIEAIMFKADTHLSFHDFRTLADVRKLTPNHEKPLIWTGTDIFNAINEMMSQI